MEIAIASGLDAHDRRQDEVAQRRHVDDVDEHRAALGVVVHRDVDVRVVGRGDHHERALEVRRARVLAPLPADRALARVLLQRRRGLGRDQRDLAVAGEQPLDLLQADLAAADHQAAPAGELQAGDVEGGVEHPLHAALVADPPAQLADALLASVGLGGHGQRCSRAPAALAARARTPARPCARVPPRPRATRARGRTRVRSGAWRRCASPSRWSRRTVPTTGRASPVGPT